jgi:SMODS-associating 2TM, beta-strand rich effector domain
MLQRLHLSVLLLFAAAIWGVMLVIEGVALSGKWFRPFSTVVGAVLLLLVVFDLWAWRLRWLQGWFVPKPDVRGTWHVELRSEWVDPETKRAIAPITAFMVVRQTFSTLSLRMLTVESLSELVAAEISKAADGTYRIAAVYRNEPVLSVRHRSPIHYGALVLDVQGDPVASLAGHYWTDRSTRGEIRTLGRFSTIASSFEHARELFAAGGTGAAPTKNETATG